MSVNKSQLNSQEVQKKVLNCIQENPLMTLSQVAEECGITYHTTLAIWQKCASKEDVENHHNHLVSLARKKTNGMNTQIVVRLPEITDINIS